MRGKVLSIFQLQIPNTTDECVGVVPGVKGQDGGGGEREGHLPPHEAQSRVVGKGGICQVGLVEEVVVD